MNKIGEIKNNNQGTPMKIVAYRNSENIDVQFQDKFYYIKEHQTYSNFSTGSIKNPYDKSVFGVGYIGVGKYKTKEHGKFTKYYQQWKNMLLRCYVKEDRHRPYEDSEVCEEWLNFQIFSKWYDENYYEIDERLHIDKDIKYKGNKIYSPYTCILVPQSINEVFHKSKEKQDDCDLPETIRRTKTGYKVWFRGENLGIYDSVDECLKKYNTAKREHIKNLIGKYEDVIPSYIKEILLNCEL